MLETDTLYFSAPSEWEDPYEKASLHKPPTTVFAQCWSRKPTSDAMWRIYSSNRLGVRIDTDREQLRNALIQAKSKNRFGFKLKNVQYFWNELLDFKREQLQSRLQDKYTAAIATESLFLKRDAFHHEHEVRVVIYDPTLAPQSNGKGIAIPMDMRSLISSVWVDSRAPKEFVDAYTALLKDKLQFKGEVKRSSLYDEVGTARGGAAR